MDRTIHIDQCAEMGCGHACLAFALLSFIISSGLINGTFLLISEFFILRC